jgi:hypothetical protein
LARGDGFIPLCLDRLARRWRARSLARAFQ